LGKWTGWRSDNGVFCNLGHRTGRGGRRHRHDGSADPGQAVGGAAGDSGVSGAVAAQGTRGRGGAGARGGPSDQRGGGHGAGRQSADGAPAAVRHRRVGRGLGGGGDVRDRTGRLERRSVGALPGRHRGGPRPAAGGPDGPGDRGVWAGDHDLALGPDVGAGDGGVPDRGARGRGTPGSGTATAAAGRSRCAISR
jgi:hypothetical protein